MSAFCENWIFSHGKSYWFVIFKFLVENCFSIENYTIIFDQLWNSKQLYWDFKSSLPSKSNTLPTVDFWSRYKVLIIPTHSPFSFFALWKLWTQKHFSNTKTQPSFPDSSNTSNPGQGITNPTFFFTSGYPIFSNLLITYESVWY